MIQWTFYCENTFIWTNFGYWWIPILWSNNIWTSSEYYFLEYCQYCDLINILLWEYFHMNFGYCQCCDSIIYEQALNTIFWNINILLWGYFHMNFGYCQCCDSIIYEQALNTIFWNINILLWGYFHMNFGYCQCCDSIIYEQALNIIFWNIVNIVVIQ